MTTMGKYRHISRAATADGHFVVLAIDHRTNLQERLMQQAGRALSDDEFMNFKQSLLLNLTYHASATLADPAYSIGMGVATGAIKGQLGVLAPIEVTNYNLHPSRRDMHLIPSWSVEKIKLMGGDGVKLLLPYNPDSDSYDEKIDFVRQVIADCTTYDLPFYLEPIPFSLDPDKPLANDEYLAMYLGMCKTFCEMGVDVLKLPFPVDHKQSQDEAEWVSACEAVTEACTVPWALLSAGVDYDTFLRQTRIACAAGASGVIVGRAVWAEVIELDEENRLNFLTTTAASRMQELADVCATSASSWRDSVTAPDGTVDWYERYFD